MTLRWAPHAPAGSASFLDEAPPVRPKPVIFRLLTSSRRPKPGYWVISYPLYGVQQVGAPCPKPQAAAQSPDGLPMLCLGARGWQPGWFTGAGFFPPEP
ncbi:conserved hypothetical protein [Mycobacterium tuberculosis T92]|nr:conserved hypothetical protein [Mycobacterium tuberculosis T92]